jgi:hypothetical protein
VEAAEAEAANLKDVEAKANDMEVGAVHLSQKLLKMCVCPSKMSVS